MIGVCVETCYGKVWVNPMDTHQYPSLLCYKRPVDDDLIKFFMSIIHDPGPEDVFIDGGGCYGLWSLAALHRGFKHVVIYEAQIYNVQLLDQTFEDSDCVDLIYGALGVGNGKARINYYDYTKPMNYGGVNLGSVQLENLGQEPDNFEVVDGYICEDASVLKLDIEGMELLALKDAKNMLTRRKPPMIVETLKGDKAGIKRFVTGELGYKWAIELPNDTIFLP